MAKQCSVCGKRIKNNIMKSEDQCPSCKLLRGVDPSAKRKTTYY